MKLSKLPKKKIVTISDLLHISDTNESCETITDILNDVCSTSHKYKKIFIMTEEENGENGAFWKVGYDSKDLIYLAEIIKWQAISEDYNFSTE